MPQISNSFRVGSISTNLPSGPLPLGVRRRGFTAWRTAHAPPCYTPSMSTADTKRIEKIARESAALARKTLKKTNELETYLSLLEYKAGKVREFPSVAALTRKVRSA